MSGETSSARLDELMDSVGVSPERDKFDVALLEWFEAETGLVLPETFQYALPRMADSGGDDVLLPVPGKRQWWIKHLGRVTAPVYRHYLTKHPRLTPDRDQILLDWAERENDVGEWFRTRRSWAHEQLWPIAHNNQLYFCFDFRFDPVDPPVVAFDPFLVDDPATYVFQPVEYIAPSFTVLLEQAARWEELEEAPYEPTEHHLAWERSR